VVALNCCIDVGEKLLGSMEFSCTEQYVSNEFHLRKLVYSVSSFY
jgi:hypothetical protein